MVRIHVTSAAGGFDRAGIDMFIPEAIKVVAAMSGDPSQAGRTWIYITEAVEDGLGLNGVVRGLRNRDGPAPREVHSGAAS